MKQMLNLKMSNYIQLWLKLSEKKRKKFWMLQINRLKQWFEQRSDRSVLLQLQRAAHSLKGGARMARN